MSQLPQDLHLSKKQKESLKKIIVTFFVLIAIFITFFPLSLIWLFFIKRIKNYFLSNKELLEIKAKLKKYSLANSSAYQQKSWYGNMYKQQKQEEVYEQKQEEKNNQTSFYEQNRKKLQEKFSENIEKKNYNNSSDENNSWRNAVWKTTAKNNNFFWNNKKSKTFWSGKSIWDNYESVTDKFNSNNK